MKKKVKTTTKNGLQLNTKETITNTKNKNINRIKRHKTKLKQLFRT